MAVPEQSLMSDTMLQRSMRTLSRKHVAWAGVLVFWALLGAAQLIPRFSETEVDASLPLSSLPSREAGTPWRQGDSSWGEKRFSRQYLGLKDWASPGKKNLDARFHALSTLEVNRFVSGGANGSTTCEFDWPSLATSRSRVAQTLKRASAYEKLFQLDYVRASEGSGFNANQSLEERAASFHVAPAMKVHCGFASDHNALGLSDEDRRVMDSCTGVVVVTSVTRGFDLLKQPLYEGVNETEPDSALLCHFAFADEETIRVWAANNITVAPGSKRVGVWRVVRVTRLPYAEPTLAGRVFKHLTHRLFPFARYSVWMDGKILLKQHPLVLVDFFLLQHNRPYAVSTHPSRVDVLEEVAEAKPHRPEFAEAMDKQVEFYQEEGTSLHFDSRETNRGHLLGMVTDVCETSVIFREHNPLTDLFSCLWFNEIDRFQPRDQLSFSYVRRKMSLLLPLYIFPHCQREAFLELRNHVFSEKR